MHQSMITSPMSICRVGMVGTNNRYTHGHPGRPHVHQPLGVLDIHTLHMDMEVLDAYICTSP